MLTIFLLLILPNIVAYGLPFEQCAHEGLCLGHLIEVQENVDSMDNCTDICREFDGCRFASFHQKAKTCTLSKSCNNVVLIDQPYLHQSPKIALNCTRKI